MTRQLGFVILCGSLTVLGACATKSFVQKQLSATETKLTERANATETNLTQRTDIQETKQREQETKQRETADRVEASRQAIHEVGALASGAKTRADSAAVAAVAAHDAGARLAQRLADRNKHRVLETRSIYFDVGQAEIRSEDINKVEDVANALKADPNAVLELQGFADPRGSDRYNHELARERVETVIRYLVQRHGIELRQLRAVAMGKAALVAGEKPTTEAFAKARRVDIRLLAPWSSWEDTLAQTDQSDEAGAASPPTSIEADRPATPTIAPRDVLKKDAAWLEIMKTISPQDLGAKD
jgi:outer membrane protein OmpA-like peptidoglycan-associated protein